MQTLTSDIKIIKISNTIQNITGRVETIYDNQAKVEGSLESINGMTKKTDVIPIVNNGMTETICNNLIFSSPNLPLSTYRQNPLCAIYAQAHFCRGETQQHLQKKLVH